MDPATTQATARAVEETAKTAGKGLDIVHDTGGYLRQVFGDAPTDLVGVVGGAWLHEFHIRLRDKLRRRTEQILRERNVDEVIELSPNVAAVLISGAQEEAREELAELWARLLANAMDPKLNNVRQSFIGAVKKMDPADAIFLKFVAEKNLWIIKYRKEEQEDHSTEIEAVAEELHCRPTEVQLSLIHLRTMGFFEGIHPVQGGGEHYSITVIFREFMRACYPEISPK